MGSHTHAPRALCACNILGCFLVPDDLIHFVSYLFYNWQAVNVIGKRVNKR